MTRPRKTKPAGSGRPPVDPKTHARIAALHAEGKSRNAIARELGISGSTVTRHLPPGSFDRSRIEPAIQAAEWDAKRARLELSKTSLVEAGRLIGLMSSPHTLTHWTKDGELKRAQLDLPQSGDVRNYAVAAAVLVDKHLALIRADSDDRDLPAVDAWLEHVSGLAVAA